MEAKTFTKKGDVFRVKCIVGLLYSMDQKEFDQLLKRYSEGDVSQEEKALVDHWYDAIEHTSSGTSGKEKHEVKQRLQSALGAFKEKAFADAGGTVRSTQTFMPWGRYGWPVAASIVMMVTVASVLIFNAHSVTEAGLMGDEISPDENIKKWEVFENKAADAHLVTLQDGSEIMLEPGAMLEYPELFDPLKREVRLKKGNAFFQISRDEKRPFYVYSYEVVTRVLGTSFIINSNQKGEVTVDVKTGSVSVSAMPSMQREEEEEIILTPNQRGAYDPQHNKIVRTLIEKPRIVIPSQEVRSMIFEKASIATIFHAVEKAYNVKIRFDDERFSTCVLTTYLIPEEDLYTRLKIICGAIGATYHEEDGNVIVKGKGC